MTVPRMEEPPPQLGPDEVPSPEEFSRLARELLREAAGHDPDLAQRLREAGFDPEA
jgi:hypothetical protein